MDAGDSEVVMHVAAQRNVTVVNAPSDCVASKPQPETAAQKSEPAPAPPAVIVPIEETSVTVPEPVTPPPPVENPTLLVNQPPKSEPTSALPAPVPAEIPTPATGHVGIAIVWQVPADAPQAADIDLYVAARPGAPEVSWRRWYSPGAVYYRDIRSAGAEGNDDKWRSNWEYVEVTQNADLSKISVWLNVYRTHSPVSGIVRVQYQGQIVDHPFTINVTRGNAGWDSDLGARKQSPYWQEVRFTEFSMGLAAAKVPVRVRRNIEVAGKLAVGLSTTQLVTHAIGCRIGERVDGKRTQSIEGGCAHRGWLFCWSSPVLLRCSPKVDPPVMRVWEAHEGGKDSHEEEATNPPFTCTR